MDMKKLLLQAVGHEQAAFELYDRLAKKIKNAEGAAMFANLAKDETGHRVKLEEWWRRKFAEPLTIGPRDAATAEAIEIDTQAGAVDALELALEREKSSATLYESLAASAVDPDLRRLCQALSEQEWGHFATIRAEIAAVTGDFYWLDIDYASHVED